ncbi:MAG: ABC transporter ATP-binding protein [bacterium]|nr:ABC transporter ATP-binding protein [bacterium]
MLKVDNLITNFDTDDGQLRAVDGISISVAPGQFVGIVGESGSGKSVTAHSIMGLLPKTARCSGSVKWNGNELLGGTEAQWRHIRGKEIGLIFQNAQAALNPVFTIGSQMIETILLHHGGTKGDAANRAIELLRQVNLTDPEARMSQYPHECSLGMCQRIMIAITLAMEPRLLIADEPTASLDVTVQAQIMRLIKGLQTQYGMGVLMISHDLGLVAQTCDRVCIMYLGKIVEEGTPEQLFRTPKHPYTQALIAAIPSADPSAKNESIPLKGEVPSPFHLPKGCRFSTRCPMVMDQCKQHEPELEEWAQGRRVACLLDR